MKLKSTLTLLSLLSLCGVAQAQSGSGNATRNGDYENFVKEYEAMLPSCTPGTASGDKAIEPNTWINRISYVFVQSVQDGERDFMPHPDRAYLHLKAALDAVSEKAKDCQDLRSILSRPIAEQNLKVIQILEEKINTNGDTLSKARILFDASKAGVLVANKAATTIDTHYFIPYNDCWNPRSGFFGATDNSSRNFPVASRDSFSEQLLSIAADELQLVDSLGILSPSGVFVHYFGVKDAYLPVAQQIVNGVYDSLKTNLLVVSREVAFVHLEVLKNDINHYVSANDYNLSLPVMVQDIHQRSQEITQALRSCFHSSHY